MFVMSISGDMSDLRDTYCVLIFCSNMLVEILCLRFVVMLSVWIEPSFILDQAQIECRLSPDRFGIETRSVLKQRPSSVVDEIRSELIRPRP